MLKSRTTYCHFSISRQMGEKKNNLPILTHYSPLPLIYIDVFFNLSALSLHLSLLKDQYSMHCLTIASLRWYHNWHWDLLFLNTSFYPLCCVALMVTDTCIPTRVYNLIKTVRVMTSGLASCRPIPIDHRSSSGQLKAVAVSMQPLSLLDFPH